MLPLPGIVEPNYAAVRDEEGDQSGDRSALPPDGANLTAPLEEDSLGNALTAWSMDTRVETVPQRESAGTVVELGKGK